MLERVSDESVVGVSECGVEELKWAASRREVSALILAPEARAAYRGKEAPSGCQRGRVGARDI